MFCKSNRKHLNRLVTEKQREKGEERNLSEVKWTVSYPRTTGRLLTSKWKRICCALCTRGSHFYRYPLVIKVILAFLPLVPLSVEEGSIGWFPVSETVLSPLFSIKVVQRLIAPQWLENARSTLLLHVLVSEWPKTPTARVLFLTKFFSPRLCWGLSVVSRQKSLDHVPWVSPLCPSWRSTAPTLKAPTADITLWARRKRPGTQPLGTVSRDWLASFVISSPTQNESQAAWVRR